MSTKYEAEGAVIAIGETKEFGNNGFRKRDLVIETEGDSKYPQAVKFEVVKDECDKLDNVRVGQIVKVHFNLRGREYNGNYYTNLTAWRLDIAKDTQPAQQPSQDLDQAEDIPF